MRCFMEGLMSLPAGSQRLRAVLNFLIEEKIVHSQTHFGDLVGVSKGNMSKYLNGQKEPKEDLLTRVIQAVQPRVPLLSESWLLTGEGSMLIDSPQPTQVEANPGASLPDIGLRTDVWVGTGDKVYWTEAIQVGDEEEFVRAKQEGVKLIPEFAEAFRGGSVGEGEMLQTIDTYWGLPDVDGNMIVPVRGDSLSPRYPSGCRVVLKPYPFNPRTPLLIPFGEVFAVAVRQEEGFPPTHYIKKLHRHPDKTKELQYYIARSFNDEYEDFEIPISDICFLSAVVAKIELEHTFTF